MQLTTVTKSFGNTVSDLTGSEITVCKVEDVTSQ